MKPTTQYTKSGSINIAYQVFGAGAIDLVYIPGWVSNIDLMWDCPEFARFLEALGRVARVIVFDKRGIGLSDPVEGIYSIDESINDVGDVMDAAGSGRAVLFGHWEGACMASIFAASYPHRVISLITYGLFARRTQSPEYPFVLSDKACQIHDSIENEWGCKKFYLNIMAPSKMHDDAFGNWLANYYRSGASPSTARNLCKRIRNIDILSRLSDIKVPTLVMHRNRDELLSIEEGRFVAKHISTAQFVELDGEDHLFWTGDTEAVLNEITTFISRENAEFSVERQDTFSKAQVFQLYEKIHKGTTPTNSFLERVLKVIASHIGMHCFNVNYLCKEIGMSERQVQRKLKALTNQSPQQLINSVRLNHARQRLLERKCSISKVAFGAGFSSPSHFSQCFRREFGLSPSALLEKMINEN